VRESSGTALKKQLLSQLEGSHVVFRGFKVRYTGGGASYSEELRKRRVPRQRELRAFGRRTQPGGRGILVITLWKVA